VSLFSWLGFGSRSDVAEAAPEAESAAPSARRIGYESGVPLGGTTEYNQGSAGDPADDLTQLYDAYVACPWAGAGINAIARTVTAGGLITDWTGDNEHGGQEVPEKPPQVARLEQLLAYCNPREDAVQILRGAVSDLGIFGKAFLEIAWFLGEPIAIWSLDATTMRVIADEHGEITQYVQVTDQGQKAVFEPHQVIYIALDAPRSGLDGLPLMRQALLSVTTWLFAKAAQKETYRAGDPPTIHVDFPAGQSDPDMKRWVAQYRQRNRGTRNIGNPIVTKNGGRVEELQRSKGTDLQQTLDQCRDEILSILGVPPAKVGVIESGNLGGGTGEEQDKTFQFNTCGPLGALVLEKLNYHLVLRGFGITDWKLKWGEVDWRDSKVIEEIRDKRLHSGAWTLNRYRADINEPPVDGGDEPAVVERESIVLWRDIERMSEATIAHAAAAAVTAGIDVPGVELVPEPEPEPIPAALAPFADPTGPGEPEADDVPPEEDPQESRRAVFRARLREGLALAGEARR
jgi:hypothetical protein